MGAYFHNKLIKRTWPDSVAYTAAQPMSTYRKPDHTDQTSYEIMINVPRYSAPDMYEPNPQVISKRDRSTL